MHTSVAGCVCAQLVRAEYRRPRAVLLSLVGEFAGRAAPRLLALDGSGAAALLDCKSHAVPAARPTHLHALS